MRLKTLSDCIRTIVSELCFRRMLSETEWKLMVNSRSGLCKPGLDNDSDYNALIEQLQEIIKKCKNDLEEFGYKGVSSAMKNVDLANGPDEEYVELFVDGGKQVIAFSETGKADTLELKDINDGMPARRFKKEFCCKPSPKNIEILVKLGLENDYKISPDLLVKYQKILEIKKERYNVVPYIDNKPVNMCKNAQLAAQAEIGCFAANTAFKYTDRKFRYGFVESKAIRTGNRVTDLIVNRKKPSVSINYDQGALSDIVESVADLDRFPVMVVLGKDTQVTDLNELVCSFSNHISKQDIVCLYRDAGKEKPFNKELHRLNISNKLSKNTKVVIVNNKMPKIVLTERWKPITAISTQKHISNRDINCFISHNCDAIIYFEEKTSIVRDYRRSPTEF